MLYILCCTRRFPNLARCLLPVLVMSLSACAVTRGTTATASRVELAQPNVVASAHDGRTYACGGEVESRAWRLWDEQGRPYLKAQLLHARLEQQGDTYALYDIQIVFHNLQAMAQRCGRNDRLVQMADDLLPLFDLLQPLPGGKDGERAWVCRGGLVCNERNRLVNTEVMLVSAQGLGLLSALARSLAASPNLQARAHPFIDKAVQTGLQHLQRWGGAQQRSRWAKMAGATPDDVKDGSSALFFTDHVMWQMVIYAHLAGIAAVQPDWFADARPGTPTHTQHSFNLTAMLRLFNARISLTNVESPHFGSVKVADMDAGFWRLYSDNRFAGYAGTTPPAVCKPALPSAAPAQTTGPSRMESHLQVDPSTIRPVQNLGWDISHARRLVQFFDAFTANRHALQAWWDLQHNDLPAPDLPKAFAAQLLTKVWNGDITTPLFTNYWSGAYGWYRVAYDNGTGRCFQGYKPSGLSDSFPTGGYAQWASYYPLLGVVAQSIYKRAQSVKKDDAKFIGDNYAGLVVAKNTNRKLNIQEMMFWPSLIR